MTPGTYVSLEEDATIDINGVATTFPAGTWYGEIVQAQLDADEFPSPSGTPRTRPPMAGTPGMIPNWPPRSLPSPLKNWPPSAMR